MRILFTPSQDACSTKASSPAQPLEVLGASEKHHGAPAPTPPPGKPAEVASLPAKFSLADLDERIRKNLEDFMTQVLEEWRQLQSKADPARPQGDEKIQQYGREIAKLTAEVAALRKLLVDLHLQKDIELVVKQRITTTEPEPAKALPIPSETPAPKVEVPMPQQTPAPPITQTRVAPEAEADKCVRPSNPAPEPSDLLNALAGPALPQEINERKVAFFAKLWDYLNQPAFEIPTHKSDRTR